LLLAELLLFALEFGLQLLLLQLLDALDAAGVERRQFLLMLQRQDPPLLVLFGQKMLQFRIVGFDDQLILFRFRFHFRLHFRLRFRLRFCLIFNQTDFETRNLHRRQQRLRFRRVAT